MLRELHLGGFKCFENLTLKLDPLTLLAGLNGGGKSSIMQSLALLSQTFNEREWGQSLLLEGRDLALGSALDVINQRVAGRQMVLGATTHNQRVRWTFHAEDRRALSVELTALEIDDAPVEIARQPLRWLLPAAQADASSVVKDMRNLSWITAERTGPRELLPLRDAYGHAQVGVRGELAAGLIYWREANDVRPELCMPDIPPTLFNQVRGRMQEFFPGCDLRITPIDGASAVCLRLRLDSRADFQRPQNVGFGLTQLFPILVALLAASEGSVMLIENPEVHLHPRAQQNIGVLLARVAATGVQVLVETHSDHVLNGVRIAVKRGLISHDQVSAHFFSPSPEGNQPRIQSPGLDSDGRLDSWPEGFFDQLDVALAELL